MELKHLRSFIAIADAGSISKAAQHINIVQPALSQHLNALEHDVRAKLFLRTARGVELTDAGEKLLSHAKFILHRIDIARSELSAEENCIGGTVSIGCLHGLADSIAPSLIPALKEKYPAVSPAFFTYGSNELQKSMVEAELDMYLTYNSVKISDKAGKAVHEEKQLERYGTEVKSIAHEQLLMCSLDRANQDATAGVAFREEPWKLAELPKTPLATPPQEQSVHRCISWIAEQNELDLEIYAQSNSMNLIVKWLLTGECAAILPVTALRQLYTDLPIIAQPLEKYDLSRELVMCGSPNIAQHSASAATMEFAVKHLHSLNLGL